MAQDDYYYEIQLTNKQLVFYFLAGATGLVLSFLAGVMVGRGVDQGAGEVHAARPAEERVIAEETPRPAPPASTEDLTYAQRLESDKAEEGLQKAKPAPATPAPKGSPAARTADATPSPAPASVPTRAKSVADASAASGPPVTARPAGVVRGPDLTKPSPISKAAPSPKAADNSGSNGAAPASGHFTIQVGAFKDKAAADTVVARLKGKGFAAYVVAPEGEGLFNVRVGSFSARGEAERVQARLRDDEKFKPFIVKP